MHVCHLSPSRLLHSHVSPVLAVPARSLRHYVLVHNLAVLSRPESAGYAPLRTCIEEIGYVAKSDAHTGYDPKNFDKITSADRMLIDDPDLNEISDFSKKTHTRTKDCSVF